MDIDTGGASAPADTGSVASNEPVIAATPAPVSTEPRTIPPGEAAERARQAEEAKLPADKAEPKKAAEPVAEKAKPLSTRDALRKAAEKVNAEPAKDAKPVTEKAVPLKDGQPRAVDGKFASTDPAAVVPAKDAPKPAADTSKPAADTNAAPELKPAGEPAKEPPAPAAAKDAPKPPLPSYTASAPPSRFSPDAKEAWATAPEPVRAEVARMERELTAGFEKHRAAAERDGSIAEFHELAAKGGTTVKDALAKYVDIENQLRADPIKGLEIICQNAGMSLREVAAHIMGQTPEQQAGQQDSTIREMRAEIADLKSQIGGVTENIKSERTQTTQQKVEAFAADPANSRFNELSDDIAFFLKTRCPGNLLEAYRLAERLNPAPVKAPVAELPAASSAPIIAQALKAAIAESTPDLTAQTLKGQKSIAGAPTAGSDPVRRQPSNSPREAIKKAFAAIG